MTDREPRYRIGAVARLTGVSTHALRVWERRYTAVKPNRSAGGDRLYSDADVQRLRYIKRLLALGHAIGDVASLPNEELTRLLDMHAGPQSSAPPQAGTVERYLFHVERMDSAAAEQVLAGAALSLERREFIQGVVVPVLHEVGRRWQDGELHVSQEHMTSAMVRSHLGALLRLFSADPTAPTAIAATLAGELHELGALLSAVTAAMAGWRAVYLGSNLPASEVIHAAQVSAADTVLISVVGLDAEIAVREIQLIARSLPPHTRLIVGGQGEASLPELPARVSRLKDLSALEAALDRRIPGRLVG